MVFLLKNYCLLFCFSCGLYAQDVLAPKNLDSLSHQFTLVNGRLQGDGAEFLKKATAQAQFTLLGDYPDSKGSSDLTAAMIPLLQEVGYRTLALGVGRASGRLLDSLSKELQTLKTRLKTLNTRYAFTENNRTVMPMPDMKSVSDAEFLKKAGERQWSLVGFGYESWNGLLLWIDAMYENVPAGEETEYRKRYLACSEFLRLRYSDRNGELMGFYKEVTRAPAVTRFLELAMKVPENALFVSSFKTSMQRARMHAERRFFEKNQLRINDEKRFLKQELDRIGFDMDKDKLFVKWDRNFLSRGFQPYAFYGIGNTLSEIASFNGSTTLHMAIFPRYKEEEGELIDVLANDTVAIGFLQMGKPYEWTVIDLRPLVEGFYYAPVKYELNEQEEDLVKRFDLLIIPPTEQAVKLLVE